MIGDRKHNAESKMTLRGRARIFKKKPVWFKPRMQKEREKEWTAFEAEASPLTADIFRVARYLVSDRETAEDLTLKTFTKVLKSFYFHPPETACRAWLVTILYQQNSERCGKLGQTKFIENTAEQIAFMPAIPNSSEDEIIWQALQKLPPAFRETIVLSDVEEFSPDEIAAILQIPIETVTSRLLHGRKLMLHEIKGYEENFDSTAAH